MFPGKFRACRFVTALAAVSSRPDAALPCQAASLFRGGKLRAGLLGRPALLREQAVVAVRTPGVKLVLSRRETIGAAVNGYVGRGGRARACGARTCAKGQGGGNSKKIGFHAQILA